MPGGRSVQLGEHGALDLHALRRRLDDEVDVAEVGVVERAVDATHDLIEAGVGLLLGHFLLGDEPVEAGLGQLARLVEAVVDELLLDVLEHNREIRRRDRLGDFAAHRAGADHCRLEYEQLASVQVCG